MRPGLTDGDAPGNVSVLVGAQDSGIRAKHRVYVQGKLVLTSASEERVQRAVIRALGDLGSVQPPGTIAARAAVVFAPDGRAILVDRRLARDLWNLDRRLRRQRYWVIDSASVHVDTATGTAVLTHPVDLVDGGAAASLLDGSSDVDGLDDLRGGSIPISRVVFAGDAAAADLAESLAQAAPMTRQADNTLRIADVKRLLELLRRTESRSAPPDDAGALMAAIGLPAS